MSTALMSRLAFRQSRLVVQRRAQSSASSTAESAKEAVSQRAGQAKEGAQQAASKAQEGLSRVSSSAGNVVTSAATTVTNVAGRIGGRTGAALSWIQGMYGRNWDQQLATESMTRSGTPDSLLRSRRRRTGKNHIQG